jgi:endoglucanase
MHHHRRGSRFNVALLGLAVCGCPDKPPPAAQSYVDAPVEPTSVGAPSDAPGATATGTAAPNAKNEYPAAATKPAPVPLPPGAGSGVRLQKYIVVDQFGYRPELAKVAVLVSPVKGWNAGEQYEPGPELEVRRWSDAAVVMQGAPQRWQGGKVDEEAGDRGAWFDFSAVKESGLYYVFDKKNNVRSHPFEIGPDVYRRVLKTATKAFYFNRANVEKKPPYACVDKRCWSLGADNVGPGQDREARSVTDRGNAKTARDLSGGWWDAGDTNKYVTFTLDPIHQLLTAYTERPQAFTDDFGIPESGNGIPDLIDEVLVELEWLKKMQAPDLKGGALIKLGVTEYADPVPDQSRLPRFYYPGACSSATIVVASEFAHAALVLKQFPRFESEIPKLTKRARDAWAHFQANPKSDACDNGTIRSGDADMNPQGQEQTAIVAAVYLFALTGDAAFGDFVKANYTKSRPFTEDRWSAYLPCQGDALLYYARLPNADATVKQAILERKKSQAESVDIYKFRPELDLYRAYLRGDSYHWGSNNVRAGYGNTNYDVVQYSIVPAATRATYLERAAEILHSFHGVNPMQLVYLTNMYADGAEASADETYHAWFRDKDPIWDNARSSRLGPAPGYVTGGPNKHYCEGQDPNQHACAKSPVRAQPPEKAYVDVNTGWEPANPFDRSWEINEPAIYYQASYVRLVSKFVGN